MSALRMVIVTGLSGSGKSAALKSFEDMGFYCVDNLRPLPSCPRLRTLPVRRTRRAGQPSAST